MSSSADWTPFTPRSSSQPAPGSARFEPVAYLYPGHQFALDGIALRAGLLGAGAATGLCVAWQMRGGYWQLPVFLTTLGVFHFMEFWITARFNTRRAEVKSFLLSSNGAAYNIAHASAFAEAIIEWWLFPGLKTYGNFTAVGLVLIVLGQLARSYAMAHAGTNFSHIVASRHEKGHVLVTTGIYGLLRHPSYFGFFWWGVGTQIMLGNPLCSLGYASVLWVFFSNRINREEDSLVGFFGEEYVQYRARTMTGIPFIR